MNSEKIKELYLQDRRNMKANLTLLKHKVSEDVVGLLEIERADKYNKGLYKLLTCRGRE